MLVFRGCASPLPPLSFSLKSCKCLFFPRKEGCDGKSFAKPFCFWRTLVLCDSVGRNVFKLLRDLRLDSVERMLNSEPDCWKRSSLPCECFYAVSQHDTPEVKHWWPAQQACVQGKPRSRKWVKQLNWVNGISGDSRSNVMQTSVIACWGKQITDFESPEKT